MAIKRKAVIMKAGEYKYGDTTEQKVNMDLREMARLPLVYPITYGHPAEGIPDRNDVVGSFSTKWDDVRQEVIADAWFFDEAEQKIDPAIWQKIVNYEPVGVSPGYKYNTLTEDGAQLGTLPNHLAIARPEEDPRCPLGECGVNVRFDTYKYDQILQLEFVRPDTMREDSTEEPPAKESQEEASVEAEPTPEPDVAPSDAAPEQEQPAEQKPEEEAQEQALEEVQREPEVAIPASVTTKNDGEFEMVDGYIRYVPRAYRDES